jgi:hypothetical protein
MSIEVWVDTEDLADVINGKKTKFIGHCYEAKDRWCARYKVIFGMDWHVREVDGDCITMEKNA